jgi:putative heme transporter
MATTASRRRRALLLVVLAVGGLALVGTLAGSTLADSFTTFAHLDWPWLLLALIAEAGSMAAFARAQRRLLRVGGTRLNIGSVMAVTYAGNAISVSLPLAGSEMATAFSFRQFGRHGIDAAVAGWALAVSGIVSALAFAVVLAGGALASGSSTAALLGLGGAVVSLMPTLAVLAALRYQSVRRALNRLLARLLRLSRRLFHRPGPDAEGTLERFLDRVASLRFPRLQYAEVFALALWNWVADCLCLACAIRATGAEVPWQGLFLAYGAGMTAASLGFTPGGLGIIEAALAAALIGAGIKGHQALGAVLVYRLISFWLVMAAGWGVLAVLTRAPVERAEQAVEGG